MDNQNQIISSEDLLQLLEEEELILEELLDDQIEALTRYLDRVAPKCFKEQKHTKGLCPEKIYWHYGRLIAYKDLRRQLHRITFRN